jgi:drug/metabolite transporter (DMT)-like permease
MRSHIRPPPPREATMNKTLGIVLIVLGLFGLAWGGFTYTTREKVVDIGPIHATREKTHNIPLSPIAGAVALIGGVVLLVAGKKE